jgi:hypothetical protein
MPASIPRPAALAAALLAGAAMLSGCSGGGENVRLALCRDAAVVLAGSGSAGSWTLEHESAGRFEDLVVRVTRSGGAAPSVVECHYSVDQVAQDFDIAASELDYYETNPSTILVDGTPLSAQRRTEVVNDALLAQGRRALDRAGEAVDAAGERVREALDGG